MVAVQEERSAAVSAPVRAGSHKRIEWVDVAKGLCMMLVVLGHTLPYGNLLRNFIFSFHMPLFFFLTGYTARLPDSWSAFARRVRKDFVGLIVPVLGVVQVFNVLLNYALADDKSLASLWEIARYNALTLFWASGNPADGIPSCGMPWFLFAMFWGKLIWEALAVAFPKGSFALSMIVALFGAYIGQVRYLPQCLDVAMLVVLYLALGHWFRGLQEVLEQFRIPLLLAMVVPWAWCCQAGIYIELASRTYENFILCALESVCGIWIFCQLCRELSANPALRRFFSFWGRHSLWLFFVHHMDVFTAPLWQGDNLVLTCLRRFALDLLLTVLLLGSWTLLRQMLRRTANRS